MENIESTDFISKIKSKDSKASSLLVTSYTKPMFSSLRRMGYSIEESEDIIQSTWITFFDVVQRFEEKSKLKTFLFGVMFNKISEFKRKNLKFKNEVNIEEIVNQNFDDRDNWNKKILSPDLLFYNKQISHLLKFCLDLIPEKQKMAFQLKEIDGEETEEICKILDISISNLGVLLFRARNQLRECFESKSVGGINDKV